MNNKKQSSVELLAQEIDNMISFIDIETSISFKRIVEQAKAMHKEEVTDAYIECWMNDGGNGFHKVKEAEQYYNETFGGQDNE